MHVAFRTDASLDIGTGHVMRCLTLAEALRKKGADCQFVCREHPGNLLDLICQRGFKAYALPAQQASSSHCLSGKELKERESAHVRWLGADWAMDAAQTKVGAGKTTVDWLIVDHYAIDVRWEQKLRPACRHLMIIDDLADRSHDGDLLLDQNWFGDMTDMRYDGLVPAHCAKLLGPQHALLDPEYVHLRKLMPTRDGIVRRVLVFLGGSDPTNQTAKVLASLTHPAFAHLAVDVVIGINHPDPQGITNFVAARPATTLYRGLPTLAGLMARADLMIGAGGSTSWERMCLGLPAIVISIADNQTPTNRVLSDAGYIYFVGEKDMVTCNEIIAAVQYCLSDSGAMRRRSELMQGLVTGDGARLLAEVLHTHSQIDAATATH